MINLSQKVIKQLAQTNGDLHDILHLVQPPDRSRGEGSSLPVSKLW